MPRRKGEKTFMEKGPDSKPKDKKKKKDKTTHTSNYAKVTEP